MSIIYYMAIWVITGFIFGTLAMKMKSRQDGPMELGYVLSMTVFFLIFGAIPVLLLPFLYIMKIVGVKLK